MPKITFFSLCLLAVFSSNSSFAQSKGKSKPLPAKIEINWDQSPFNLESENVGLNYEGHSCYQLFNALATSELKKDEFESNSAYGSRIESLKSKKLFGDLSLDSFYAIVVGNSNNTVEVHPTG